jgi:hypothetical protein
MGDDDPSRGSVVPSYPPPSPLMAPPPSQPISLLFALGAALAAFLGYCLAAAILALLSFGFGLWAWLQLRAQIRAEQQWALDAKTWYGGLAASKGRSAGAGTGTGTATTGKPDQPSPH